MDTNKVRNFNSHLRKTLINPLLGMVQFFLFGGEKDWNPNATGKNNESI